MPLDQTGASRQRDPFKFLKAVLIGAGLGAIAVMLSPYLAKYGIGSDLTAFIERLAKLSEAKKPGESKNAAPSERKAQQAARAPESAEKPKSEATGVPTKPVTPVEEAAKPSAQSEENAKPAEAVPAAPSEAKEEVKPEAPPILIPAIELTYPKTFSNEEMTEALAPILGFRLADADAAALKDLAAAISKGQDALARAALARVGNPTARKFGEWKLLRVADGNYRDIIAFQAANPRFPILAPDGNFEKYLFLSNVPGASVLKIFEYRKPLTGAGRLSLGAALMESGERERGLSLIRMAWTRHDLDPAVASAASARFGNILTAEDNQNREQRLALKLKAFQEPAVKTASLTAAAGGYRAAARLHAMRAGSRAKQTTARLRAQRYGGRTLRGVRHTPRNLKAGNRRRARQGVELSPAIERGHGLFGITSLAQPVLLRTNRAAAAEPPAAPKSDNKTSNGEQAKAASAPADAKAPASETPAKPQAPAKDAQPAKPTLQKRTALKAFKLSSEIAASPPALLGRLKALRRQTDDEKVWSLLLSLKPETADLSDPERWWEFRRTEVRRALDEGSYHVAYRIASVHGPLEDETASEAEFLAGWIAFRYLKDPEKAQVHFAAAKNSPNSVRDRTRAAYWLARAKLEMRRTAEAQALFEEAASRFYLYYGALARQALRKDSACEFRAPPRPSKEDIAAFTNEDAFKAIAIIKQLDLQPLLVSYILDLARQLDEPGQMTLLLELAQRVGPPHLAVRAAKIALLRGFAAEAYAFPALLPKYDPASGSEKLEPALLNALTRQESEFNPGSMSQVGARGLMQLMPATAKLTAAANKLKFELGRLTSDPSYNVTLGSAFLASLISGYDGSYILSLAAYNAGPGRAAKWIKDFGDPRGKAADPVDWVERIPFTETREYVQRILESIQLYRCRIESGKSRFQLFEDLHRGRPGKMPDLVDIRDIPQGAESDP